MRALKVLVVVMGLLIIGGTLGLIGVIVTRVSHPSATTPRIVAARGGGGGRVTVDLPAGAQVSAAELAGEHVLVRVTLPGGGAELLLFDAASGARLAVIDLRPAPSGSVAR